MSDKVKQLAAETPCPQCGQKILQPKKGRFGEYLACPNCKANFSLRSLGAAGEKKGTAPKAPAAPREMVDVNCPQCGHTPMEKRVGRFGPYYRCPECKSNFSEKKMGIRPEE